MPQTLVLTMTLVGAALAARAAGPKCFVVNFAPVRNIPASTFIHWVTIVADRPQPKKQLNWAISFSADKTPQQVRDRAFDSLQKSTAQVKKLGETKLLFSGCLKLEVKTLGPKRREFAPDCRPTVTEYATGEEAQKAK